MSTIRASLAFLVLACALSAQQQTFDNSGNGLLRGKYNFRQVIWVPFDPNGTQLNEAVALYGTITFSGTGTYALSAKVFDSSVGQLQSYTFNGAYAIPASGNGYIQSPVSGSGTIYGLVSKGMFIGSSTEDALSDIFVAAPASDAANNGSFSGAYWISELNFPSGFVSQARNASSRIVPNGSGGIATADVSGYVGISGLINQSVSGATYSFAGGIGTLNYGGTVSSQSLLTGTRTFYVIPGSDFIFGGSPTGYDFFVGVRALPGQAPADLVSGLYYHAGVDLTEGTTSTMFTYSGAAKYDSGAITGHRRRLNWIKSDAEDYSYTDSVTANPDGSFVDFFGLRHIPSADGSMLIGTGVGPSLGLEIALRSPDFSGPGVYLNPTGALNAASSTPFTLGISPGELITLYGSGMAPGFLANTDFPKELNGVQVMINGRQCPIYYVSDSQIAVLVPYATTENFANIQVINNGVASNIVSTYTSINTPGLFTSNQRGSGTAAALHPDFSVVTASNPAKIGEVIAFYASGLGLVAPAVNDGDLGPAGPLSYTTGQFTATINDIFAPVSFVGLAPQLRGLYQINIQVPAGTPAGDMFVNIVGPGSFESQATIPVTRTSTGSTLPEVRTAAPEQRRRDRGPYIPAPAGRRRPQ